MRSRFKTWSRIAAIAVGLVLAATPAHADPISAAIAALVTSISAITVSSVIAFAFEIAIGIGLNYLISSLEGKPKQVIPGVTGTIQTGGIVPRSCIVGEYATAGSLGYCNTWGQVGETPNAYFTMRVDLSDLPVTALTEIWVGDTLCTYNPAGTPTAQGYPVPEYNVDGADYLWIKFYDGTQTTADSFLTGKFSSDPNYPYGADMVGYGCAYVIVTARVNTTLFSGFPTFKFGLEGIGLYDLREDSTNGGSGAQRWDDQSTRAYSNNAATILYNLFRGFYFGEQWLFGPQTMTSFRLPSAAWIAGLNEADLPTARDEGGYEPQYRAGAEISFNSSPAEVIDEFLKACNGRIAEVGGSYKPLIGAATAPVMTITDDDVIITEQQSAVPFPTLSATINAVTAHYPEPAQGWATVDAPPRLNPDLELEDGGRRLIADVTYGAVPYLEQVERLSISGINEARKFRRHQLVLPPECWLLEPNETIAWTSERNGYELKEFRLDALTDNGNLDVPASLSECDPADYDYNPGTQYLPRTNGPLVTQAPAAQGILDWAAAGVTVFGDDGKAKAGIRIEWNTTVDDVDGVLFQVRLAADETLVLAGETDHFILGTLDVTENLLPNTEYEVRGQYRPHSDRAVTWSSWLAVTTPDVRITYDELSDAIQEDLDLVAEHTIEIDAIEEGQRRADAAIRNVTSDAQRIAFALLGLDAKIPKVEAGAAQATAYAVQTLTQYTDGLVFAEAQARLELAAIVAGFTGIGGLAEFQARLVVVETATADLETGKASASQVTALDAQINTPTTGIAAQVSFLNDAVAALDPDTALAIISVTAIAVRAQGQDLSSLGSTVLGILSKLNKIEQGQSASLAYYRSEIVTQVTQGVSANASAIGELGVLMVLGDQTLQGSIVTEQQVRAAADTVNAGVSTSILAAISGYTAAGAVAAAFTSTNANVTTNAAGLAANVTSINAINAALTGYTGVNGVANAFITTNANVSTALGTANSAAANAIAALGDAADAQDSADTALGTAQGAQTAADAAQADADAAAAAASTAQSAANTANAALADIASDNKLTPVEKTTVRQDWNVAAAELAGLDSQATAFGITTEKTAYDAAFQALATYLNNGTAWSSGVPTWISDANLGTTTTIVGSTFRSNWADYYSTRTALLNAIAAKAKALADYAQDTIGAGYSPSGTTVAEALTAQASLISGVETAVGDASAGGFFSVIAQTAPGDASARIALVVHQDSGGNPGAPTTAAILLDALGDGSSRAMLLAEKIYLVNGSDSGAISDVLSFVGGVLTVPAAVIEGTLDVGTLIADDAIITRLIAPSAVSGGDFDTGDVTADFNIDREVSSLTYACEGGRLNIRMNIRAADDYVVWSDAGGGFTWHLKRDGSDIDSGTGILVPNPGGLLNVGWTYVSAEIEETLAADSYTWSIVVGPLVGAWPNRVIGTIAITELKK